MQNFIKLTIVFSGIIFIAYSVVIEIPELVINEYAEFKLPDNPKYIVLGHSHPECAFNDSLIQNFKNLSQSGESYFYTYFKCKKILETNASIKVVFIEFTNNQLDETMNDWIWKDKYLKYRFP